MAEVVIKNELKWKQMDVENEQIKHWPVRDSNPKLIQLHLRTVPLRSYCDESLWVRFIYGLYFIIFFLGLLCDV